MLNGSTATSNACWPPGVGIFGALSPERKRQPDWPSNRSTTEAMASLIRLIASNLNSIT